MVQAALLPSPPSCAHPRSSARDEVGASRRSSGFAEGSCHGAVEETARTFLHFRRHGAADGAEIAGGHHRGPAELFRELQARDAGAADRLAQALTSMPVAGEEFLGFHLQAELGRGAFARVFLAEQGDLARRWVVLKVAADVWGEAQTLAQLQHANVVPIYSVHHATPFQAVCMPFRGTTTLHDVLAQLARRDTLPESGRELVTLLHTKSQHAGQAGPTTVCIRGPHAPAADAPAPSPAPAAPAGAAVQTLQSLGYVEAVLWLGARLADGLAHAHEHGIVHRDLKPANVLITEEGQPMLLDFNVAEDTKLRVGATAAWIGGTLPYMSPEHLSFIHNGHGQVDGRSDLYALGIILFELLTGRYPFGSSENMVGPVSAERQQAPPRLRSWNKAVTPAAEAIVRRCLQPEPTQRYQTARQLQEDLERHLNHQPLRHTAEPSRRERVAKWVRRHPRLTSASTLGVFAAVLVAALAILVGVRGHRLAQIEKGQAALAAWHAFQDEQKAVQFFLYTRATEPEQLAEGITLCVRALQRYEVLDNASWLEQPLVRDLPASERGQLREAVGEMLLLLARAKWLTSPQDAEGEALRLNKLAEACAPDLAGSPAMWRQRAELCESLGQRDEARRLQGKAEALPLRSARDHYWLASERMARGRVRDALPLLRQATRLEPQNVWAWFVLGNCYDRLVQDSRAEACYATCISLSPKFAWAYFNRGLASLRQQDHAQARADFDEALALRPDLTEALINRALARQGVKDFRGAHEDLTEALKRSGNNTRIYFLRARLRERMNDKDGARADHAEGLRREPGDEKSWVARGYAHIARDPQAALRDFDRALAINPRSLAALQNKAHVLAEKLHRDAEALPVLDVAVAHYPDAAASRSGRGVLHARLGQRPAALRDAEEALRRDSSPGQLYQIGCIYALTSRTEPDDRFRAVELIASALRRGFGFDLLDRDTDLDPIRNCAEFQRLVEASRALRATAKSS